MAMGIGMCNLFKLLSETWLRVLLQFISIQFTDLCIQYQYCGVCG